MFNYRNGCTVSRDIARSSRGFSSYYRSSRFKQKCTTLQSDIYCSLLVSLAGIIYYKNFGMKENNKNLIQETSTFAAHNLVLS